MATIQTKVDDVLYATKGQKVEATKTIKIRVPGAAWRGPKAKGFDIDVSTQGEKELNRLIKAAEDATVKAWAEVLKVAGTSAEVEEAKASKTVKDSTPDEVAPEPSAEGDGASSSDY